MLLEFEKKIGMKLFRSSSLASDNSQIVIISPFQINILKEKSSSLQTDSVEAYLLEYACPNANMAVSSAFCHLLNWHISVCISLLMGKSAHHYSAHFQAL